MNLSVCIITKNEENNLRECLHRLAPYHFEIVVVDTGSCDHSKLVAQEFTPHVYDFEWCNDFSAARNYAISKATNDYIFMLDTDEFVEHLDLQELFSFIEANPYAIGRIHRRNPFPSDEQSNQTSAKDSSKISHELIERIFNKNLFHYTGSIHEQVTPLSQGTTDKASTNKTSASTYVAPVFCLHEGYHLVQSRTEKATRNLALLLEEYKKNPKDTYYLYQIGKSYYSIFDYENARLYFEKALAEETNVHLEYVQNLIVLYGYTFLELNEFQEALTLEQYYDDLSRNADYMFILGLVYMQNGRFEDAVCSFLCATESPIYHVEGVNSYRALYNIGVIYECLGNKENATYYYKKAGAFAPALEGLSRLS